MFEKYLDNRLITLLLLPFAIGFGEWGNKNKRKTSGPREGTPEEKAPDYLTKAIQSDLPAANSRQ